MADVQVDMFEVQLGAAVLIQALDTLGNPVRVLADAGIKKAAAYPLDHVSNKLSACLSTFHTLKLSTIDLLVGTHYDEDHLAGLPDVVRNFTIGHAMLPPVRTPAPRAASNAIKSALRTGYAVEYPDETVFPDRGYLIDLDDDWDDYLNFLAEISSAASGRMLQLSGEPEADSEEAGELIDFEAEDVSTTGSYLFAGVRQATATQAHAQLAAIKKSSHKAAIVAKWLRAVVKELRAKKVPIRAYSIQQGVPEYFVWDPVKWVFGSSSQANYTRSTEPKYTLLGPSAPLVSRHSRKLPIGAYLAIGGHILTKPVTASNQLSYVLLFEAAGQQILITGDAGCVDFRQTRNGAFFPALLSAVQDPSVIQIAHHGGSNAHFYNVLLNAASYANSSNPSLLLLSHAYYDALRPTQAFLTFVQNLQQKPLQLLFTSTPDPAKVAAIKNLFHPESVPPPTAEMFVSRTTETPGRS